MLNCWRCKAPFDTQENLDKHTEQLHGEYSKEKHLAHTNNSLIHRIYLKHHLGNPQPKKRGVKKGTKRGKYQTRGKAIRGRERISLICKQCEREKTYIRKGKRLKIFCSDACKQKYYRKQRLKGEIERRKSLF